MFDLLPFKVEHLKAIMQQAGNESIKAWVAAGHAEVLAKEQNSFTLFKDGIPVVVGGYTEYWPGRGYLWSCFNQDFAGSNFVPVYREMRRVLDTFKIARLEMAVPLGDKYSAMAIRRAGLLDFHLETICAVKFFPNGQDAAILARVRD